jgi:hypothetical protein
VCSAWDLAAQVIGFEEGLGGWRQPWNRPRKGLSVPQEAFWAIRRPHGGLNAGEGLPGPGNGVSNRRSGPVTEESNREPGVVSTGCESHTKHQSTVQPSSAISCAVS